MRDDMLSAVSRVFESGWYVLGNEVEQFEKEWAKVCNVKHAIGVANGMDALEIILRAMDVGPGDEVITTSMTAFATVLAILRSGATPVLADIDPDTGLLSLESVVRCLSCKTKAVVLVHLYGQVRDIKAWQSFCEDKKVHLVEDCAQAHGASINGRRAGSWGDAGAFSFYPTKNLGALGDAGCITSDDEQLVEVARSLRNYGSTKKYQNDYKGVNSRLDEMQAAILRVKLKHLETDNSGRRKIAKHYLSHIKQKLITLPRSVDEARHVWHLFVVAVEHREEFRSFLLERGVQTDIHYPIAPHHQLAYSELRDLSFPLSEKRHREVVSLPISPVMDIAQADEVVTAVNAFGV